jgi:CRP-like cAMP-binding protein
MEGLVTKFEKRAYVDSVKVGNRTVGFNCHPEEVKVWERQSQPSPDIIVIGDTAVYREVPVCCPEFPLLKSIFRQGGFDFKEKKVVKPLILVGERRRVEAHAEAIRLAFHGPNYSEFRSKARVSDKVRDMLLADQEYLATKDKDGKMIPFESFVVQKAFDDGGCARIDDDLEIIHTGNDTYVVRYQGNDQRVELTPDGEIGPSWPIPVLKSLETPHHFRIFVLGSDSGFGKGPTTGCLLEEDGEYLLWDCPPYASWTLAANGIDPGQVKKIIISHGHDDHCNDLIPFALNSRGKVEIVSTKEIIYTVLRKLAALMNISVDRLRHLFLWTEIKVGKPYFSHGIRFDWHYGFHPIPSLGAKISRNGQRYATITGDTGFAKLLNPALEAKAISKQRHQELLGLLTEDGVETVLADMGEAMIHGMPLEDLKGAELPHIYLYHRGTLPPELQARGNLIEPGNAYCIKPTDPVLADVALISEVIHDLRLNNPLHWVKTLGQHYVVKPFEKNSLIIQKGSQVKDYFYIIEHGVVEVMIDGQVVATLSKGDFFGEEALLTGKARNANIWAKSLVRLIAIPAELFIEMMEEDQRLARIGIDQDKPDCAITRLEKIWETRLVISQVKAFKTLPQEALQKLALSVQKREFAPQEVVVRKSSRTDEVYVVSEGKVEVRLDMLGRKNPFLGQGELFGENIALGFSLDRTAEVRTVEHTVVLVISGEAFKQLYESNPRVHFVLDQLAAERGVKTA